ncbi:unnamed protein product [Absidia cylindrospora]
MLQLCVICGPNKPKSLHIYLTPIYEELLSVFGHGIVVHTKDNLKIHARVFLVAFLGDIPAIMDLINHGGHMHRFGCRICLLNGTSCHSHRMYFPSDATEFQIRRVIDFHAVDKQKNGIMRSPISYFPTFHGPSFFGLDEMHLLGLGLAKHLKKIFDCVKFVVPERKDEYPFILDGVKMIDVGKAMNASKKKKNISQRFTGSWHNVMLKGGRAVDSMVFLLYAVPCLVVPYRVDFSARRHMRNLIMACHICQRWTISPAEVDFVKTYLFN